jgi:hypothetical protein
LTVFRTYKVLSGAFLLALYAFAATPVQYWHHHTIHAAKQKHLQYSQYSLLLQDDGPQQDANCSVCTHKYSSYSEISVIALEPFNHVAVMPFGSYRLSVVTAPSFSLPNKGPPREG